MALMTKGNMQFVTTDKILASKVPVGTHEYSIGLFWYGPRTLQSVCRPDDKFTEEYSR